MSGAGSKRTVREWNEKTSGNWVADQFKADLKNIANTHQVAAQTRCDAEPSEKPFIVITTLTICQVESDGRTLSQLAAWSMSTKTEAKP